MNVWHLPIEPYPSRYTWQLLEWIHRAFKRNGVDYRTIQGKTIPGNGHINVGQVLDAYGRTYYSTTQMAELVVALRSAAAAGLMPDCIMIDDMFTPGYEAIPYILHQLGAHKVKVYARNHAQSVDVNDFTFPMRAWMRHYELMMDNSLDAFFVASTCQAESMRAAMFGAPVHVVGLPFDKNEVRERMKAELRPLQQRASRVVFSSRFDAEKQPHFFMDVVQALRSHGLSDVEFAVCTGSPELRSNDPTAIARAKAMASQGQLVIYNGLDKETYYGIIADSRIQFNCALQDFVSYTMLEASTFGTPTLAPAHLSFPEALFHNRRQLYVPWSVDDAVSQIIRMLADPPAPTTIRKPAEFHHATLDRMLGLMERHVRNS